MSNKLWDQFGKTTDIGERTKILKSFHRKEKEYKLS